MNQKRFYILMGSLWGAGLIWLAFSALTASPIEICLFKNLTGLACPSCGITRAISLFFAGEIPQALSLNPFIIIVIPLLFVIPALWLYDFTYKKASLWKAYITCNYILKRKLVAVCAVVVVLAVWAHNIATGV